MKEIIIKIELFPILTCIGNFTIVKITVKNELSAIVNIEF